MRERERGRRARRRLDRHSSYKFIGHSEGEFVLTRTGFIDVRRVSES